MYESFFGLADAPFRLTPDPRYLFLSKKHAEALAHLKLGLKESSGFVCITGDVGTGKTTLLRSFLAGLGPDVSTAYVFNPPLTALELLRTINAELGLLATVIGRKRLMDALNTHLLAQRERGKRSIVVIDEAQALPIDVLEQLRLLSNLETTTEKLLRIVLVGQPQLRALLLHPELVQLNQRITLRWHMGPLTRRETAAYIAHRLGVACGGPPPRVFTRRAIRRIYAISSGVPRLINMVAHRAMLAAFAADRRVVRLGFVRQAYQEIGALPLKASAPVAKTRRVAWAAAGLAASTAVIALGAQQLGWRPPFQLRVVPAGTPPDEVADVDPPAPLETAAPAAGPPASTPAPADPEPAAVAVASAPAVQDPVAPASRVDVAERLGAVPSAASARAAIDALFAVWHVRPLAPGESAVLADLASVARARGLDHLPLVGNASMLRLLDLPAVLELHVPGAEGPRFATLTGMTDAHATLVIDGTPAEVDRAFLDRHWYGQAHVLWRDFEGLGPAFGREVRGAPVARLQALLRGAGVYRGPLNGIFDAETESAVVGFQRSRFLVPDGRVGRLTRIVLYAAAGGYARPSLGTSS
jgi:general secretion pathway protein A